MGKLTNTIIHAINIQISRMAITYNKLIFLLLISTPSFLRSFSFSCTIFLINAKLFSKLYCLDISSAISTELFSSDCSQILPDESLSRINAGRTLLILLFWSSPSTVRISSVGSLVNFIAAGSGSFDISPWSPMLLMLPNAICRVAYQFSSEVVM